MKANLKDKLNNYLANVGVLYIKLHNLHWNVVGTNFKAVHEYIETLYDGYALVLDETAEALKIQGERPLASMKEYLNVATIVELESKDYGEKEVLEIAFSDLKLIKAQAEEIRAMASEADDYAIVPLMEGHLADINKTLWFLDSMIKSV